MRFLSNGTAGAYASISYNPVDAETGLKLCTGTGTYRSVVFELATFHPFHFSAEVKKGVEVLAGGPEYGQVQPVAENVLLSYEPGQAVNVEFDVTSFKSSIQGETDANQVSVDPFGRSFEIYIDAPTLKLDTDAAADLIAAGKIRQEGTRVVYVVDADRAGEKVHFPATEAIAVDNATKDVVTKEDIPAPDQTGERKIIPFKTNEIVSAGTITLSSDEEEVIYYKKTFNIQNKPITGILNYGEAAVPAGTFVPFSSDDDTRIGVVTVGENGAFELRLRSEYEFEWNTPVKFECNIGNVEYKAEFATLQALFENTAVINMAPVL